MKSTTPCPTTASPFCANCPACTTTSKTNWPSTSASTPPRRFRRPTSRWAAGSAATATATPTSTARPCRKRWVKHATTILDFYLDEVHALGAELSISTLMVSVSPELQALADASPDQSPHRSDEPYRRALINIYAKLASTARRLGATNILRKEVGHAEPYGEAGEFSADLQVLYDSLEKHHGASLAHPRLSHLQRAAAIFGFHLASLDMRQTSDVHERVLAELFAAAGAESDYAKLDEEAKVALLLKELAQPRMLVSPWSVYSEETQSELGVLQAAREIRQRYGVRAIRNYIISHTETVSDLLEVLLLQKETGMLRIAGQRPRRDGDSPVRNHSRPAARGRHHARLDGAAAGGGADRAPGTAAGSHAGLFGFEQGWRLFDLQLGAVQGRDRPRQNLRRREGQTAPVPRPRRHGGPWRRTKLRGDPGAAAGHRQRPDPPDGAGRDHRLEILQRGNRQAQSRAAGGGDARGEPGPDQQGRSAQRQAGAVRGGDGRTVRAGLPRLPQSGL